MRVASLRPRRLLPPTPRAWSAHLSLVTLVTLLVACTDHRTPTAPASGAVSSFDGLLVGAPLDLPAQGRYIFRHWTFGDDHSGPTNVQCRKMYRPCAGRSSGAPTR